MVLKQGKELPFRGKAEPEEIVSVTFGKQRGEAKAPSSIRYVWRQHPEPPANLYNKEGFPAVPFNIKISNWKTL